MPRGPEWPIENTVTRKAKAAGYEVFKVAFPGQVGAPDRLFLRPGDSLFVEFKAPGKEPNPKQVSMHKKLRAAGLIVHVIDNVEDGLILLGVDG